jgi:EmrB/QacA subfamily drug resistance transporter
MNSAGDSELISDTARRRFLDKKTIAVAQTPVRPNLILTICCLSLLLVGMDVTIVNVALPAIQEDFRAKLSELQWILDAYTLVAATLLILSGSMSDRFGRKRLFQIGLTLFTVGSLLCSIAGSVRALIFFRALQGLGASMLNPIALSLIANAFKQPKERARAVGIWAAVAGLSMALGPVIGGILTQSIGWRSIFWINLPIGVSAVALAAKFIPESKAPRARAFDPIGQVLVFIGLFSLTYAVIEGPKNPSFLILGLFVMSGMAWIAFLFYEPRLKEPLVELHFFRSIPFSSATILALCAFAMLGAFLFLNALYLQQARGFSAFHAGLCTLPLAVTMMVCSSLSGRLIGSHGTLPSLLIAGTAFLVSTWILTRLSIDTSLILLMLPYALFGIGLGMVNPAITNSAVAGMPLSQAGVAAAIASTSRQIGAALGVAIGGTIVNVSRAKGMDFSQATHPIWWIMTACGAIILLVGFISNTSWAKASLRFSPEM